MNSVLSRSMFQPRMVRRETGSSPMGETSRVETPTGSMFPPGFDPSKFRILEDLGAISFSTMNKNPPEKDFQINLDDFIRMGQEEGGAEKLNMIFDMITKPYGFNLEEYESLPMSSQEEYLKRVQGKLLFNKPVNKAEGGEMTSDAVGIADGLDREEAPVAVSEGEGIAKVSPQQYVELMNQVRGDEIPLEGRVQELAMTVGEKDAQETPLSVLALVQPVFELKEQEQTGVGSVPEGQQMMQQQAPMMAQQQGQQMMQQQAPMMMAKDGGIVHRFNGSDQTGEKAQNLFSTVAGTGTYSPKGLEIIQSLADLYNVNTGPFDTQASKEQYKKLLFDKEGMRNKAYLDAAPLLLKLGATALDPNATTSDVFTTGAAGLAQFGSTVGKRTKGIDDAALQMALSDKASQEKTKQGFLSAVAGPLLEDALRTGTELRLEDLTVNEQVAKIAGMNTDNAMKDIDLIIKDMTAGNVVEGSFVDLLSKQKELEKNIILLNSLPEKENAEIQGLIINNELGLAQIEGAKLTNQLTQFDITKRPITDALDIESSQIANLNAQLDLNAKPDLLKQQLLQLKGNNEKLYKELDIFDEVAAQNYYKNQLEIEKLTKEINDPSKSKDRIKGEADLRNEYNKNVSVEGFNERNKYYTQIRNALVEPISEKEALEMAKGTNDEEFKEYLRTNPNGAKDLIIMFNFMKMLDPDSVVREGEQIILKKTNPFTEKYRTLIDTINGGGFLGQKQKKMLLAETKILMDTAFEGFVEQRNNYVAIGEDNYDNFNADVQLPGPSMSVYANDVTSGLIEALVNESGGISPGTRKVLGKFYTK